MRKLLFSFVILFYLDSHSQISFEKGYYIDNSNQKIDCFIKNIDWRNNPKEFDYKLDLNSESIIANIKSVKEFSIDKVFKYVRRTVNIDKSSSERFSDLGFDQNPKFEEEELFLKVLIEGKANLYEYVKGNLRRYFYDNESLNTEQLDFKSYRTSDYRIGKNNRYRQQLLENLECSTISSKDVLNLDYSKKSLTNFFIKYNECKGVNFVNYQENKKRDAFNLSLRPRLNVSSLSFQDSNGNPADFDFNGQSGFGFGIEAEFILPFNKGKWAIFIEPTYQSFNSEGITELMTLVFPEDLFAEVNYSSIELPIGFRHYFILNKSSKIFANVSLMYDIGLNSTIEFIRDDNSTFDTLEINASNNFAFGLGYKFRNRFSMEFRYFTSRDIIERQSESTNYNNISFILGYSVF